VEIPEDAPTHGWDHFVDWLRINHPAEHRELEVDLGFDCVDLGSDWKEWWICWKASWRTAESTV